MDWYLWYLDSIIFSGGETRHILASWTPQYCQSWTVVKYPLLLKWAGPILIKYQKISPFLSLIHKVWRQDTVTGRLHLDNKFKTDNQHTKTWLSSCERKLSYCDLAGAWLVSYHVWRVRHWDTQEHCWKVTQGASGKKRGGTQGSEFRICSDDVISLILEIQSWKDYILSTFHQH